MLLDVLDCFDEVHLGTVAREDVGFSPPGRRLEERKRTNRLKLASRTEQGYQRGPRETVTATYARFAYPTPIPAESGIG